MGKADLRHPEVPSLIRTQASLLKKICLLRATKYCAGALSLPSLPKCTTDHLGEHKSMIKLVLVI